MAKQSNRVVIDNPQVTYDNFNGGMEYNSHSKNKSSNRVRLIKNMEINSDGKLTSRRPLIPYDFNLGKFNNNFNAPFGYELKRVIYAPFNKIDIPFLYVVTKNKDVKVLYFDNNSKVQTITEITIGSSLLQNLYLDDTQDDYTFDTPSDSLLMLSTTGLLRFRSNVTDNGVTVISVEQEKTHVPSFEELGNLGPNLYKDYPFMIENNISASKSLTPELIVPYKINTNLGGSMFKPLDQSTIVTEPNPKLTDHIFLKATFDIPEDILLQELKIYFWSKKEEATINGAIAGKMKLDWSNFISSNDDDHLKTRMYEADGTPSLTITPITFSTGANTPTKKELKEEYMPNFIWFKGSEANKADSDNPTAFKTKYMPSLLLSAGSQLEISKISDIGSAIFGGNWVFDTNGFAELSNLSQRADIVDLHNDLSTDEMFRIKVDWHSNLKLINTEHVEIDELSIEDKANGGIVIGDKISTDWNGFNNSYDNMNGFDKKTQKELKDALHSKNDLGILLGDTFTPEDGYGFHRISIKLKSPESITSVHVATPLNDGKTFSSEVISGDTFKGAAYIIPTFGALFSEEQYRGTVDDSRLKFKGGE